MCIHIIAYIGSTYIKINLKILEMSLAIVKYNNVRKTVPSSPLEYCYLTTKQLKSL